MASQLGSPITAGFDASMQGLIGDENADQARGLAGMNQQQGQQVANRELDIRQQEMGMAQDEAEKKRMQELLVGSQEFERNKFLQAESQKYQSAENLETRKATSAEAALRRSYEESMQRKTDELVLRRDDIDFKSKEALQKGNRDAYERYQVELEPIRKELATIASKKMILQLSADKTPKQRKELLEAAASAISSRANAFQVSNDNIARAVPELKGRRNARASEKRVAQIRAYNQAVGPGGQRIAETSMLDISTPSISDSDADLIPGLEFLKIDPRNATGGNVAGMFSPSRTRDSYITTGVVEPEVMTSMVTEDLKETLLSAFDNLKVKNVDKDLLSQAVDLAMSPSGKNVEVTDMFIKAGVDPVTAQGVLLELARNASSVASDSRMADALAFRDAARREAGDQISLKTQAADAQIKALQLEERLVRNLSGRFVDVAGLEEHKTMLDILKRAQETGSLSSMDRAKLARTLGPDSGKLLDDYAKNLAQEESNLQEGVTLGGRQLELESAKQQAEQKYESGKIKAGEGAFTAARSGTRDLLGLLGK
jgi:hypothetical protein